MTIRKAKVADAAVLADLARRTFYETFAHNNDPTNMALHLQNAYGEPIQARELADPDVTTLLVEAGGVAMAYAQVRADHVPACVSDPGAVELWRFYVDQAWHGRGVAQALMDRVTAVARERGSKTIWLGVGEKNDRARAFYAKCGFIDAGEHIFLFGTDPQTDRVMVLAR